MPCTDRPSGPLKRLLGRVFERDGRAEAAARAAPGTAAMAELLAAVETHRSGMTAAEPLFDARGSPMMRVTASARAIGSPLRRRRSEAGSHAFSGRLRSVVAGACAVALPVCFAAASALAADDLSLAGKARLFDVDLAERFLAADGQVRVRRRLPTAEHPHVTWNMSDTAYMTGLYCAAQTWRYLATADPEAEARARAASEALRHLVAVTGRPGLLARASAPLDEPWLDDGTWRTTADGRRRWRGNVSSDQVDAMMFGLFVYGTRIADTVTRTALGAVIAEVVDAVVANGLRIVGHDGRPTRWGRYDPAYVANEEPMNALLMLQMVKVAQALTGLPRFDREYARLLGMGYARIGEGARLDRPPREANHSDDVLIALALYPLLELEEDPAVRVHYERAARRWFHGGAYPGIDVEGNPFATFLHRHWTGERSYDRAALDTLRHVPLDMKWNADVIAAYQRRFGFSFAADPVATHVGAGPRPVAQRGRTWSFLVHNPYLAGGDRFAVAPFETNGLDYLLSYWFGRAHGMIRPSD